MHPESTPGVRTFVIVWLGQFVSMLGSGLTTFALSVWVYKRTGSATGFALVILLITLPGIFLSPLAGVLVDRWDRRRTMMLSDGTAALCVLTIALLLGFHRLEVWHVCVIAAITSMVTTLQFPAYSAAATNVFVLQDDRWRLVSHLGSAVAPQT